MLSGSTTPTRRSSRSDGSPACGTLGRRRGRRVTAGEQARDVVDGDRRDRGLVRRLARHGHQRGRRALAHAQARALVPDRLPVAGVRALGRDAALELGHQLLRAARDARHVGAHVRDHGRLGLEREQRVERRDAVGLRRRDREPPADVVQRAPADPADARLHRVQRREQEVALRPRGVPAARHVLVALAGLRRSLPARPGRAEDGVDRLALDRRRELVLDDEVHQRAGCAAAPRAADASSSPGRSRSTRIAVALNSAVPDFGSVALIVSTLVSHLVGEVQRHEREPGPQRRVDADRRDDAAAGRRHPHPLAGLHAELLGVAAPTARAPRRGAAATCSRRSARRC